MAFDLCVMVNQIDQIVIKHDIWLKYGQFAKLSPFLRSN